MSISCFVFFFGWIFENDCPEGVLCDFSATGVGVSHFLCVRGVGKFPLQKNSLGVGLGGEAGVVRLGID